MASSYETRNYDEIRKWAESRNGRPAQVKGTGGLLRIDFEEAEPDEGLEEITWDEFFEKFDEKKLTFLHGTEKDSRFNKLVNS